MNTMYNMSLSIHEVGVLLLVVIFLASLWQLDRADEVIPYLRKMRIQSPLILMAMFLPIFTGMVMMAAKHLEFTIPNIAMIILSIVLIFFEIKRSRPLKYASIAEEGAFNRYKRDAQKILVSEIALIILISLWMYV
ncbi:MAG: hypothetical protein PF439_00180 [Helicobacteraceae bacterium]|jgi:hypothetical protein|nr:hypothetical protein [Helicobacteraceae bacterium]